MAKPKEPGDDAGVLIELGMGPGKKKGMGMGEEDSGDYGHDDSFLVPAKKAVGSEKAAMALKEAIEACLESHGLLKANEEDMESETTADEPVED